jgi:hypothetical protein
MWYRLAQLGPLLSPLLSDPTVSNLASGKNNFIAIEDKINKLISQVKPEEQSEFKNRLYELKQQNSPQNSFSSQDRMENWNNLLSDVNNQVFKQNINITNNIKSTVDKRNVGRYENGEFKDTDKLFKEYLNAQGNLNIFSNLKSSSDIYEIVSFFINNATDPKFDIVKKIIKKFPTKILNYTEVVDLLLNFYLESKLREVKTSLERKQPLSTEDKLAIDFINSKIILHSGKIGINLFNITNKDVFGALLGSISSSALEGIEGLQNQMNVNQSIQQLINKTGQ